VPKILFEDKKAVIINSKGEDYLIQWQAALDSLTLFPEFQSQPAKQESLIIPLNGLLKNAGIYKIRARFLNPFFIPGPWGRTHSFEKKGTWHKEGLVKTVSFFPMKSERELIQLFPGHWYRMRVQVPPKAWMSAGPFFYLHQLEPKSTQEFVFGAPYKPDQSLIFLFQLVTRSIWFADKPGIYTFAEFTGRKGELIDGRNEAFQFNEKKGFFEIPFKIPESIETGAWVIRERPPSDSLAQYYKIIQIAAPFSVGQPFLNQKRLAVFSFLLLCAGFLAWNRLRGKKRLVQKRRQNRFVEQVKKEISEHYAEKIDFAQLAKVLGLAEASLRKLFRKETKLTPLQFLIQYRLDQSKLLLKTSDETINEIAFRVGFPEPSYFMKAFKNAFNTTPSKWREEG